jgi:hypothetical protein
LGRFDNLVAGRRRLDIETAFAPRLNNLLFKFPILFNKICPARAH